MGVLFAVIAFHQFFVDIPTGVDPSLSVMLTGLRPPLLTLRAMGEPEELPTTP